MTTRAIWYLKLSVKWILFVLTPLILLPLVLVVDTTESRCAYVLIIMAVYWCFEVLPIPVTATIPVLLFPLLKILPANIVAANYFKEINFLLFGGLVMAIAVENSKLHRRIALRVLLFLGTRPSMIMLAFASVTAFLSMWLSNTATTALMVPIALAVMEHFHDEHDEENGTTTTDHKAPLMSTANDKLEHKSSKPVHFLPTTTSPKPDQRRSSILSVSSMLSFARGGGRKAKLTKAILLSVCYGANIGGTATPTGTGPNLVFFGLMETIYPGVDFGVTYASWMLFAIPPMIVLLLLSWLWLQLYFNTFKLKCAWFRGGRSRKLTVSKSSHRAEITNVLRQKYNDLGPMSFAEWSTMFWFIVLVALWFTRKPKFMPGWGALLEDADSKKDYIHDACAGVFVGLILCIWPRHLPIYSADRPPRFRALVTWQDMQTKMAWGVLLIMGGSFALAAGVTASGLSAFIGCKVMTLIGDSSPLALISLTVFAVTFLTEVASNTAIATIFIPILLNLAQQLDVHPLYLALPATIAPSFAFMLPVATPPNAIVYETRTIRIWQMMLCGLMMNLICIAVTIVNTETWANLLFSLKNTPEWAKYGKFGDSNNNC